MLRSRIYQEIKPKELSIQDVLAKPCSSLTPGKGLYIDLVSCLLITERIVGLWCSGGKHLDFMFYIYKKPMAG